MFMDPFHLDIITPLRNAFAQDVTSISVPTPNGTIEILAHHIALFTTLVDGEVKITTKGKEFFLAIGGGFMEVTKEGVSVLVSRAVHADELNESDIKKAHASAKNLLKEHAKGIERGEAQSLLRRSILELKVLHHRRGQHTPISIS
jgi:F-type H+-transporting ATPase subunit epsilon